jgi:hypothetical protein
MVLFRLQTVLSQLSQARWSRVLAEQIHMWGRPNVKSSILSLGCTTRYAPVSRKGFIPYLRFIDWANGASPTNPKSWALDFPRLYANWEFSRKSFRIERGNQLLCWFMFCRFGPAEEKFFPQQIVNSVLFHNLSGRIDSSMHRSRSSTESANLMIEGSQIRLQDVNTLNSNSILSQPAASQPASQHASEEIAKMR